MLRYGISNDAPVRPSRCASGSSRPRIGACPCRVTETVLYYRGSPPRAGSTARGSIDRRHFCATCMRDPRACQGAGHMELAFPVYHVGFVDTLVKVLRDVLRVRAGMPDRRRGARSRRARPHLSQHRTRRRAHPSSARAGLQPAMNQYPLASRSTGQWTSSGRTTRNGRTARPLHRARRPLHPRGHDAKRHPPQVRPGHSHPKDMVVQTLVVPPPCSRPAFSSGQPLARANDLAVHLLEILKRSNRWRGALSARTRGAAPRTALTDDMCGHGSSTRCSLVNRNNARQAPGIGRNSSSVNSRSSSSSASRAKRAACGATSGKRVDFSARASSPPCVL